MEAGILSERRDVFMKSEVLISQLEFNPFSMIKDDGFLISAVKGSSTALMTAGWGLMGILWNKPVVTVYVRPSRYTFDFLKSGEKFTLSFFPEDRRDILRYCGSHSGHNEDKLSAISLRDSRIEDYIVYDEAVLTFACRKIYMREMDERLVLDKSITETYYADKDVHWSFSGLIEHVYI